jgi:succinoglycan biosynthesis transport protein ExoP
VAYTMLEREAASDRELYDTLLQREKELQVLANSRGNNVRVVERAAVPRAPSTPDIGRTVTLGLLVGLMVAAGLVLSLDYLDDTVKTPDDITRKLGLPCLGTVPALPDPSARRALSGTRSGQFGEAIRSLRTSIAFSHGAPCPGILLVTSAQPLEGKSTTASHLAVALAYGGAKVLLIDADMRRPSIHKATGVRMSPGLADILLGETTLTQAVTRVKEPSLWILPAGTLPDNPSELLTSAKMAALMGQLKQGPFDWVVVDTPPVLAVTDASVLAKHATGVAFILGAGMTRRRAAERAIETLAIGGPRILGAVLNRVEHSPDSYYAYEEYHVDLSRHRAVTERASA